MLSAAMLANGCGGPPPLRLRFVSSLPAAASWSFVIDDRGQGASLLVDERPRPTACERAGRELRCQVRGLFSGGHVVELRLPGAVLRRSVVIGRAFPERPLLMRVRTLEQAREAVERGLDAILVSTETAQVALADLADVAHKRGVRIFIEGAGAAQAIERAAADGTYDQPLDADLAQRFPDALALRSDAEVTALLGRVAGGALGEAPKLRAAQGVLETHAALTATLALLAPHGAVIESNSLALVPPRRNHPALRAGAVELIDVDGAHLRATLRHGGDQLTLLVNGDEAPWSLEGLASGHPLDLLGTPSDGARFTLRAKDAALIVEAPALRRSAPGTNEPVRY